MCTSRNSNVTFKFLNNLTKSHESIQNLVLDVANKNKKEELVCISQINVTLDKKQNVCKNFSKFEIDSCEKWSSNDIFYKFKSFNSEMYDVNENPSEQLKIQNEKQENVSDNDESGKSSSCGPCEIGLLERLLRSHPVWFLPGIQRAGAVHLLQGKEEGNFIVRQSSQPDTMAVSVRLPIGKGPYIEHYLIQAHAGQLSLESSENMFQSIPSLIAHYCQCCDELPVKLLLPRTIREARNRQQLSSLALLGQEFWRYPMANPRPPELQNISPNNNKADGFCSSGEKKTLEKNEEIILDLVPLDKDSHVNLLGTFKTFVEDGAFSPAGVTKVQRPQTLNLVIASSEKTGSATENKTPPQPPPRWTKPLQCAVNTQSFNSNSDISDFESLSTLNGDKFSKLENIDNSFNSSPLSNYECDIADLQSDQKNTNSFGFKKSKTSLLRFHKQSKSEPRSPAADNINLFSNTLEKTCESEQSTSQQVDKLEDIFQNFAKECKVKESSHYQESDILESPTLHYYKSNVADKQSDYEDIWATDSFTTFRPHNSSTNNHDNGKQEELKKTPDLLEKLENSSRLSFIENQDLKISLKDDMPNDFSSFQSQNTESDDEKHSSPFYAEPADALIMRKRGRLISNKSRHSDPFSFNNWSNHVNPYFSGGNILGRIDSQNDIIEELSWKTKPSLSFDNIINFKKNESEMRAKVNQKTKINIRGKPVRPPKVYNISPEKPHQNWAVDSSWEFIGNETSEKEGERRFPSIEQQMDSEENTFKYTVQEMIVRRYPQFQILKTYKSNGNTSNPTNLQTQLHKIDMNKGSSRISAYDNLSCDRFNYFKTGNDSDKNIETNCDSFISSETNNDERDKVCENETLIIQNPDVWRLKRRTDCASAVEDNEDTETIFSEPWDSSRWENLLPSTEFSREIYLDCLSKSKSSLNAKKSDNVNDAPTTTTSNIKKKISERPNFPFGGFKSKELSATEASIRSYALHLASDKGTTFAQNIDNFIECTLESKETNPQIVMRNMRQFMSGMKNYLVKHGEREFEKQVEKERMKLKATEFLNLDSILEGVMHKLVVRPLREHLYKLFVDEYIKNGAIQLLYENLIYAKTKSLSDLGFKTKSLPTQEALETVCHIIFDLQKVDSPLEKLDHLLAAVSTIIFSVKHSGEGKSGNPLGADDILPLFIWVLVQSGFIAAEIEAEYMWGLLHPSLLSGEGCYYLTTLSSAVYVLKNLKSCGLDQSKKLASNEWQCGDLKSVLRIIVPDELHGSILTKTLPVKPNMTTKDVCKIIAHKIRITNPQDYGLFRLVDGEETLLNDSECPQDVKAQLVESGKHCTLAYKRIDAKIGWPRTT